jgi:hypothetical protein
MKCSMCSDRAEVEVSWPASEPQVHKVCEACAASIWNTLSLKFTGTPAYLGFTIEPLEG